MPKVSSVAPANGTTSVLYQGINSLARKTLLALATFIPFESTTSKAYAENKPEKEKIVRSYAEDSWTILKQPVVERNASDTDYRWNNIIAALLVGDNTNILDLDRTRNEILSLGKENPAIPFNVLETAIYTSGVNAEAINKKITENNVKIKALEANATEAHTIAKIISQNKNLTKRKQKSLQVVIEYLNAYPVDTLEKGIKTRKIIPVNKLSSDKLEKAKNFQRTVNYAIAQLCNSNDVTHLVESFLDIKDKDREIAINFLDILNYLSNNSTTTIPKKLSDQIKDDLSNSHLNKKTQSSENSTKVTNETKMYLAKSILLLSQVNHKNTNYFCKRWFEVKPVDEEASEADYVVLKTLCIASKYDKEILKTLKLIAATSPNVFFDSYFSACQTNIDSPKRQAVQEIINVFNKNPDFAHELFISFFNKNVPLLETDLAYSDKTLNILREASFSKAIIVMSSLHSQEKYIEALRKVTKNNNENEENRINAMHGLAKAKDKASIENLLQIALDESNTQRLRFTALETVLLIDSPNRFHKEFLDKLFSKSPFNLDFAFIDPDSRNNKSSNDKSQYLFKIHQGSTEEDTIYSFVRSLDIQYGGSKNYLKELSSNKNFKQKYLMPLIDYLKECKSGKRIIDLKLAHLMIYILGKSNISEASELLADITTYPELYIRKAPANQITNVEYTTTNTVFIKLIALSCLGDVIDLHNKNDNGAKVLHTLSRFDSSYIFYTISDVSLLTLSKRYETTSSQKAIEHHRNESIKTLTEHIKNKNKEKILTDWYIENNRTFILSLNVAKLGGTEDLLKIVLDISKEKPKSNTIRAIIQSLFANGFTVNDIEKSGFNTNDANKLKSIYKDIVEERFWLSDIKDSGLTGKGVQVAVIDGGHIISPKGFYPALDKNITIPSELIGLHAPGSLLSRHAHSVIAHIKNIAPDVEILSLTWDNLSPIKPSHRPSFLANDNTVITLEHLIEGIIEGKYKPQLANCSFGIKGWLINTKEDGEVGNLPNPDLRSALLELLANTGTLPIVTIGNDYGKYPGDHRNGEVAEWNALGLRFLGNGKFIQPKNIIHVSALDDYNGIIAPFNGIQDPLRTNTGVESIGVHGTLILPSFYQHRGTLENKPGSGNSFSAPRLSGVLSLLLERTNNSGISLTAQELRNKVFNTARDIPESKYFEVRKKLDPVSLFKSKLCK